MLRGGTDSPGVERLAVGHVARGVRRVVERGVGTAEEVLAVVKVGWFVHIDPSSIKRNLKTV